MDTLASLDPRTPEPPKTATANGASIDPAEELCLLRRAVAKAMASEATPAALLSATEQVLARVAEQADRLVEYVESDALSTRTLDACVAARLAIAHAERKLRGDCSAMSDRYLRLQTTRRALYQALAIVAEALARGNAASVAAQITESIDGVAEALALRCALAELRDGFSLEAARDPRELPWVLGVAESELGIFCARVEFMSLERDARRALLALRSELGAWRRGPREESAGRWLCERLRGIAELFPRLNLSPGVLTHDRVALAELACIFSSDPLWGQRGPQVVDRLLSLRGLDAELDGLRLRCAYDAHGALPAIERRVAELRYRSPRSSDWPSGLRAAWVGLA